jgi:hypothetical protein
MTEHGTRRDETFRFVPRSSLTPEATFEGVSFADALILLLRRSRGFSKNSMGEIYGDPWKLDGTQTGHWRAAKS